MHPSLSCVSRLLFRKDAFDGQASLKIYVPPGLVVLPAIHHHASLFVFLSTSLSNFRLMA